MFHCHGNGPVTSGIGQLLPPTPGCKYQRLSCAQTAGRCSWLHVSEQHPVKEDDVITIRDHWDCMGMMM